MSKHDLLTFESMRHALLVVIACACLVRVASTHGTGASVTWNREISRIVHEKCASCHRPDGTAFSLLTFLDAQPLGTAIKDAVLARHMPPWGAVKGFGQFRNDQSLSQEQIELITKWVDGGIRRGNNPDMLPKVPEFKPAAPSTLSKNPLQVSGAFTLDRALWLDGVLPERVPAGQSMQIVAVMPGGHVEPLVWLHGYDLRYPHPFLFRRPIHLPANTVIRGVPSNAVISLLAREP